MLEVDEAIAVSDLLAIDSDDERFQRRLMRLMNGGQIELVEGNWRLRSSAILTVARCIDVIRAIMGCSGGSTSISRREAGANRAG
jgi:hypothetical protein